MRRLALPAALALAACAPPAADPAPDAPPPDAPDPCPDGPFTDRDEDGDAPIACGGGDCDDGDPGVGPGAPDARWANETVALANPFGYGFVVAPDGSRHLAWGDAGVWYATDRGGGWAIEQVDASPFAGIDVDLALAPDGTPHVAYHEAEGFTLRHAARGARGWVTATVDATTYAGFRAAIAIGPDGAPGIAHARHLESPRAGDEVRWSWRDGATWRTEVVATDRRRHHGVAAAIAGDGEVVIAWNATGGDGLGLRTGRPGAWVTPDRPAAIWTEWGVDVAIGGDGAVWVVAGTVRLFVRRPDEPWARSPIEPSGMFPQVALEPDGAPIVVAETSGPDGGTYLAVTRAHGDPVTETVVSTGGPFRPRIVVTPDGATHVAARHPTTAELRVYRNIPDERDEDCDGTP